MGHLKRIVFDIDGTICSSVPGEYTRATPMMDRIELINRLYNQGTEIVFHTARGMGSSDNDCLVARERWEQVTINQLDEWGVKYHHLYMCKPSGDLYVDDKAIHDSIFFSRKKGLYAQLVFRIKKTLRIDTLSSKTGLR